MLSLQNLPKEIPTEFPLARQLREQRERIEELEKQLENLSRTTLDELKAAGEVSSRWRILGPFEFVISPMTEAEANCLTPTHGRFANVENAPLETVMDIITSMEAHLRCYATLAGQLASKQKVKLGEVKKVRVAKIHEPHTPSSVQAIREKPVIDLQASKDKKFEKIVLSYTKRGVSRSRALEILAELGIKESL